LQKALKERTSECDSLKKRLEKFERDRQQWENQKRALEAKQPLDVQMLQSQKRELTMQLDREQAEKQELFLQINSLIAQLADANRDTVEEQKNGPLKAENETLKKQMDNILAIQSQLNMDVQTLQDEVRRKSQEVEKARNESEQLRVIMDSEKSRLECSLEELQRELQMKSAALQSLMLVKQETKMSEADSAIITRLTVENEELRGEIDQIRCEVESRVTEISEIKLENETKAASLQSELIALQEEAKRKEAELSIIQNNVSKF
uniref:GOLGA2L5 domain-containing protein n=1 Tax=Thelazia callipaeda TaxID=103827 RepID=A0A0N5CSZ7_THECL